MENDYSFSSSPLKTIAQRPFVKESKSDRVFDMGEDGNTSHIPYTRGNNPVVDALLRSLLQWSDKKIRMREGRYFYYTKDTARFARSGLAGNNAYLYSLGDPNAEIRPLTQSELSELNVLDRFAYNHHFIHFSLGTLILLAVAAYIGYQYNFYENLWPSLLLLPSGIFIFIWLRSLNISEGGSLKTLSKNIIAFGDEPVISTNLQEKI